MGERFKEVLDEASREVAQWPDWKKSEALKQSERANQSGQKSNEDQRNKSAKSTAAGRG